MSEQSTQPQLKWQRTPWLTLGFFIAKEIKLFIKNFTNFLPALAVIFVTDSAWVPYALGGSYLVYIFISALLNHRFFLFALSNDAVHLRTGVLGKKSLTLKYERIQQAELEQTWYFRPFNLTILKVDSAGSAGKEVEIPGLPMQQAQQLRQLMLATAPAVESEPGATTEATQAATAEEPQWQTQFNLAEIIKAGVIDNKIFVLLALLSYPLSQTDWLQEQMVPWLEANIGFIESSLWLNVGLVLAVLSLLFVLAIAVTVITYYGLAVSIDGDRYQARSGLFSIRTVSFRYPKLQRVQIKQNLRARLLKRFRVRVSQLQPTMAQHTAGSSAFILPVVNPELLHELRQQLNLTNANQVHWQSISALALLSPTFWVAWLAPIACLVGYFAIELSLTSSFLIAVLLWGLMQTYVVFRWRNYGFSYDSTWLAVKHGVLGRTENWYPYYKIQQLDVYQSPWLRMLGFAHIIVHTAAGAEVIKYQSLASALQLQQQWIQQVGQNQQRWM
ncbi:PH domain-containing protein [Pseudidiomarina sp. WS423]|uniref:PH domain-containing protein n=1 Tax=Pseudidiomarina sp. WS423 TaxID=3425124 RepID=UPI003D6E095C